MGDYNIGLDRFVGKTALYSHNPRQNSFLLKISQVFKNFSKKELSNGSQQEDFGNAKIYQREKELLQVLKKEIFEIEYFQHSNNWKNFLEDLTRSNDEFIDKLVSI